MFGVVRLDILCERLSKIHFSSVILNLSSPSETHDSSLLATLHPQPTHTYTHTHILKTHLECAPDLFCVIPYTLSSFLEVDFFLGLAC